MKNKSASKNSLCNVLKNKLQQHTKNNPFPGYKQPPLKASHYISLQKKLLNKLPLESTAVITSNSVFHSNTDREHRYFQNSNLLYLSGIIEKNCTLLFHKDAHGGGKVIGFKNQQTSKSIVWEGECLSFEMFSCISGIKNIYPHSSFWNVFSSFAARSSSLWFAISNQVGNVNFSNAQTQMLNEARKRFPLHSFKQLSNILNKMRIQKNKQEINAISNALLITENGLKNVVKQIYAAHQNKVPLIEYELEAMLTNSFLSFGSNHAFLPIIASGRNACTLHYINNNHLIKPGSSILIDCGATYSGYNADITRVLPFAQTFTKRQAEVYKAVYNVLQQTKSILKVGLKVQTYTKEVSKIMLENLCAIGLIKKQNKNATKEIEKYFMHGISHQLGIDVHDVTSGEEKFLEGMVLTVEPGIYITEESIGIRLEDNVVITNKKASKPKEKTNLHSFNGCICLSKNIPLSIESVQQLMQ